MLSSFISFLRALEAEARIICGILLIHDRLLVTSFLLLLGSAIFRVLGRPAVCLRSVLFLVFLFRSQVTGTCVLFACSCLGLWLCLIGVSLLVLLLPEGFCDRPALFRFEVFLCRIL